MACTMITTGIEVGGGVVSVDSMGEGRQTPKNVL